MRNTIKLFMEEFRGADTDDKLYLILSIIIFNMNFDKFQDFCDQWADINERNKKDN